MKEFYKSTQSIFKGTNKRRELAVSYHNVGDLLKAADAEFKANINNHYGPRSGANDYGAEKLGIVVDTPNPVLENHSQYLSALYQRDFRVYTPSDLQQLTKNLGSDAPKPLVVPYFNNGTTVDKFNKHGAETWGMPSKLVEELKNKARFHNLIQEVEIEGFEVPEYSVSEKDEYVSSGMTLLRKAKQLYEHYDLTNRYPLGVMIRLEESDGNYGSSLVRQEPDGRISITPDGNSKEKHFVEIGGDFENGWKQALIESRNLLYKNVDTENQQKVIISRYLDLEDSPGLSLVFIQGDYFSLGWNGQLMLKGSSACVGTSSYVPKTNSLKKFKEQNEAPSAAKFAEFIHKVADKLHIPVNTLNGVANVDIMIYGALEKELRSKQGKKDTLYVAESNPRWTNFTDAIMVGIGATGRETTISNMLTIIENGIYTEDHVDLHGAEPATVRAIIQQNDTREKDNRVVVRMPDDPMGIIYLGDHQAARKELHDVITEAGKTVTVFKNK